MLRSIITGIVLVCICATAYSFPVSRNIYWIFFRDKGIATADFRPGTDLYEKAKVSINEAALKRRPVNAKVTIDDLPLYEPYLATIRSMGLSVRTMSKWLNGVTVVLDDDNVPAIQTLPFVDRVERAAMSIAHATTQSSVFLPTSIAKSFSPQALPIPCGYDSILYHYGMTHWHLDRIGVIGLHAMGVDAQGITIGFTDTGFNPDSMRTLRSHRIVEGYDFVFDDTIVHDDERDPFPVDDHGSVSLSSGIGYYPDSLIGPAYKASAYLAKTEDLRSETPAEEGYYAEALEWFEARGVPIASNSLGYMFYDSGHQQISYEMLDGKTTVAARAALKAARNGMLVLTSAGNKGDSPTPYVMTPADADSILAVGATFVNDSVGTFTSRGLTVDGRRKPDILAPGAGLWSMGRQDDIKVVGGTSFATPLAAGACALIMQAHPEVSAQAVRSAVIATGRRNAHPDSLEGFPRINAFAAALHLGTVIGPHRQWREDSIHHLCVGLAANNTIRSPRVVYAIDDDMFIHASSLGLVTDSLIYSTTFPAIRKGKRIRYYIETQDGADTVTRSPRNAPLSFYEFNVGDTTITDSTLSVVPKGLESVSVYPNPARDKFIVTSSNAQPVRYQLIDINGKSVLAFESTAFAPRIEVQLGSLPNGVYTLHGQLGDGSTVIRQTIIHLQ